VRSLKFFSVLSLLSVVLFVIIAFKVANDDIKESHLSSNIEAEKVLRQKTRARSYNIKKQKLKLALEDYFQRAIASGQVVGVGVSVVKGDSIVISEGFGKRSINRPAKVDGETIFRLGSLSKGFAGILMADLEEEGKIKFDDKVIDYLPEFKFGNFANTQKVKVSHILSHTAGTPYHSFTNLVEAGLSMKTIASRFNEVRPNSAPGVQYSYQNAMFALSQEIARKATGKDTKTLLKNRFFRPLGMANVSMSHVALMKEENVAIPHYKRRRGWRRIPLRNRYYNAVAAGGINASSLDMGKWMRFLLGYNPEVMKRNAVQEVFKPAVSVNNKRKYYQRWPGHLNSSYGYGWRIHEFQDSKNQSPYTVWHHGGSVNNFRNEIAIYPDSDLGICVLLNGNSKIARTVIPDLYEIVKSVYKSSDFLAQAKFDEKVQLAGN